MQICGNGLDYSTRGPLIRPMEEKDFAKKIAKSLKKRKSAVRYITRASGTGFAFREVSRERTPDLGDPVAAGWTYLVNEKDPHLTDIVDTIRPLADHRGMADPDKPLTFSDEKPDEWLEWMTTHYWGQVLRMKKVPHYILIIGSPDQVPFHFQSLLDTTASVGRLDFDGSMDTLAAYVEKVIRLEQSADPAVDQKTVVFAPDGGPEDATHYSRQYMAVPLAEHIRTQCGCATTDFMGESATKDNLAAALAAERTALVYTASHGIAAPDQPLNIQKQYNGAICCQSGEDDPMEQWLYTAEDVPEDTPFLEGAVFFQFACYGYGTPAESDFMHWLGSPEMNSEADFVAALPKKLLSLPRGPLAYIGHVDTAWLHGFADPDAPDTAERWSPRMAPFVRAVEMLLQVKPVGLAMATMNEKYSVASAVLSSILDRAQRGRLEDSPEFQQQLSDLFITRSDAQNYMIFGDPAVRLRIHEA